MNELFDNDVIVNTLKAWFKSGDVFEIRILEALTKRWSTKRHTESGYFDYEHIDDIPSALGAILDYRGVYVTINPLQPAALGRSANRFKSDKLIGAKDEEVLCRRGILIDCDAKRLSGVSSSDEEHSFALAKAEEIAQGLSSMGWPEPLKVDSGNGAQLLYRVDLPTQDNGLVKRCLEALLPCSDAHVDIDQTVFNAARIWRLPGTQNRKGDELPEQTRVYRMSTVLSLPEEFVPVKQNTLESMALPLPESTPGSWEGETSFDIDGFVSRHFPEAKAVPYEGGRKWVLDVCPFNPDHNNRSAMIRQSADGRLGFVCHHNSCRDKNWHDLRALLEPREEIPPVDFTQLIANSRHTDATPAPAPEPPPAMPLRTTTSIAIDMTDPSEVEKDFPEESPVVIDGILRERETMNIIAAPKTGKSWFVLQLAIAIALGRNWFRHECVQKRVLLIDNELHKPTFAGRLRKTCVAMGVHPKELDGKLKLSLQRGNILSLEGLKMLLPYIKEQHYGVVIVDALYRALPSDIDENSNMDIRDMYNLLDTYAMETNTSFILVHHTSKGNQSEKSTTDVGAGAGSQSRAVDTHMIMLHHMEEGAVVIRSVNRSFKPQPPFCLRMNFPLWSLADDLDPRLIEGLSPKEVRAIQHESDAQVQPENLPVPHARTIPEILASLGGRSPKTALVKEVMTQCNLTRRDATDALDLAVAEKQIEIAIPSKDGKPANSVIFCLPPVSRPERIEDQ